MMKVLTTILRVVCLCFLISEVRTQLKPPDVRECKLIGNVSLEDIYAQNPDAKDPKYSWSPQGKTANPDHCGRICSTRNDCTGYFRVPNDAIAVSTPVDDVHKCVIFYIAINFIASDSPNQFFACSGESKVVDPDITPTQIPPPPAVTTQPHPGVTVPSSMTKPPAPLKVCTLLGTGSLETVQTQNPRTKDAENVWPSAGVTVNPKHCESLCINRDDCMGFWRVSNDALAVSTPVGDAHKCVLFKIDLTLSPDADSKDLVYKCTKTGGPPIDPDIVVTPAPVTTTTPPPTTFDVVLANGDVVTGKIVPVEGENYGAFWAIPYAKPPIDDLRFKPPEEPEAFSKKDVSKIPNPPIQCMQREVPGMSRDGMSEDCLYLNVFTPKTAKLDQEKVPVFFFIHGGNFDHGCMFGFDHAPIIRNLVRHGMIVVMINYRLGPFGFYTTKKDNARGNLGFLDMLMALKWVRKNIGKFGGDPDLVTLVGQGSGAIGASLLNYSPLSMVDGKALFKYLILHSGTSFSLQGWQWDMDGDLSSQLSAELGCSGSAEQVLQCMQDKDADDIQDETAPLKVEGSVMMWGARIDGYFLLKSPSDVEKTCAEAVMIGVTKEEMAIYVFPEYKDFTKDELKEMVEGMLTKKNRFQNRELLQMAVNGNLVEFAMEKGQYFWAWQKTRFLTMILYHIPAYQEAMRLVGTENYEDKKVRVYFFLWDYVSEKAFEGMDWKGAVDWSDIGYLFAVPQSMLTGEMEDYKYLAPTSSDDDWKRVLWLGEHWYLFALKGKPGWEALEEGEAGLEYFSFAEMGMKKGFGGEMGSFWFGLFLRLARNQGLCTCPGDFSLAGNQGNDNYICRRI